MGIFRTQNSRGRRIEKKIKKDEATRIKNKRDIEEDKSYFSRILLVDSILDRIEEEVDRRGGINGIDGRAFADILSFYIDGDPRYSLLVQKELIRRSMRK